VILGIFLNQKSYKYFPRKKSSNFTRILRDFKDFTKVTGKDGLGIGNGRGRDTKGTGDGYARDRKEMGEGLARDG
jgi:hypothetical protein